MISIIKNFFEKFKNKKIDGIGVFVFNDYNTYKSNDPHIEECYNDYEIQEVYDAFAEIFSEVLLCPSEQHFLKSLEKLKDYKSVYVYTMAQYVSGYSRRALIPALCEFYHFKNINADTYTSVIGVNKKTMFELLNEFNNYIPKTYFFSKNEFGQIEKCISNLPSKIIIKPECESCCIDIKVFEQKDYHEVSRYSKKLFEKYNYIQLQEFIEGKEIGVTVLYHRGKYIALNPVEMKFKNDKNYLSNIDSRYNNFDLEIFANNKELCEIAEKMAKKLDFKGVSRFDFRLPSNGNFFLFDISPNPTLSKGSSCNIAFIHATNSDYKGIYKFLAYNSTLLEPPFNSTKHY